MVRTIALHCSRGDRDAPSRAFRRFENADAPAATNKVCGTSRRSRRKTCASGALGASGRERLRIKAPPERAEVSY